MAAAVGFASRLNDTNNENTGAGVMASLQDEVCLPVHIQANLEDELVKEALKTKPGADNQVRVIGVDLANVPFQVKPVKKQLLEGVWSAVHRDKPVKKRLLECVWSAAQRQTSEETAA
ncbi:UNVERIFIED_CONTAM: hypothetical protein FKN15_020461 [Acipenser sinensis]